MYILASNMNAFYGRGYGSGYYMFDWTYLLVLIGLALSLIASANVKNTFNHYAKIRSRSNLTGAMAAERVLHRAGIYDVSIQRVAGNLTDHYDPRSKTLRLSDSTYGTASIAAVCVAAHECGHAIQDQKQYGPLVLRSTLVPLANFGSSLSWPVFFAGLIFSIPPLLTAGIILFSLAVLFQLVRFRWSLTHLACLKGTGGGRILGTEELAGGKKVLRAAALTYVAALASSILQLLRLIILAGGRRDRD